MHRPSKPEGVITMPVPPERSAALYKVHFFGPFRVIRENQPVGELVWRRNKAKSLLKWFLLNPGRMFSADQLIKCFWPNLAKPAAERNFHVAIHYLRHVLEPDLPHRQTSKYIHRSKENFYWFELDGNWWADIFDIHYHYTQAKESEQRGELTTATAHYRQVVEYCRLGFLHEDAYEDTFSSFRHYYERIYTESLELLMQLYTQTDMIEEVLVYAHHALLADPYCEPAIRAIAHSYFRQGNPASAIRKLDYFQSFLQEELGIEPEEDMRSLRKKIAELE